MLFSFSSSPGRSLIKSETGTEPSFCIITSIRSFIVFLLISTSAFILMFTLCTATGYSSDGATISEMTKLSLSSRLSNLPLKPVSSITVKTGTVFCLSRKYRVPCSAKVSMSETPQSRTRWPKDRKSWSRSKRKSAATRVLR